MAKFAGGADTAGFAFTRQIGTAAAETVTAKAPIHTATLAGFPLAGAPVEVRNTSERVLYASIVVKGMPRAGEERASSSGLEIKVSYTDADGRKVDIKRLRQGADFVAELSISNHTDLTLENLALTQIVPSGWEIHNARLDGDKGGTQLDYLDIRDDRVYRYFGLKSGETKRFKTVLNAAYIGRYYLPSVAVEAMYDATKQARTKGRWVEVAGPGQ